MKVLDLVIKSLQRKEKEWQIGNSILEEFVQSTCMVNPYLSINPSFKTVISILNTNPTSNNGSR